MEENKQEPMQDSFVEEFDDPNQCNVMRLTVPLQKIAEANNINSVRYLLGFFEQQKNLAMLIVHNKQQKMKNNGVIIPEVI